MALSWLTRADELDLYAVSPASGHTCVTITGDPDAHTLVIPATRLRPIGFSTISQESTLGSAQV